MKGILLHSICIGSYNHYRGRIESNTSNNITIFETESMYYYSIDDLFNTYIK